MRRGKHVILSSFRLIIMDMQKPVNFPLRQFQLFVEPTEYILDLVEAVYLPRGVTCAFAYDQKTLASRGTTQFPVLEKMSFSQRIGFIWKMLRTHEAVAIHSYADPISLWVPILNLFWRRILTFEVDSAWREPQKGWIRLVKRMGLGFWFKRPYVWGCAIGGEPHRDFFLKYGLPEVRLSERPNIVCNARYVRTLPPPTASHFRFGYVGRLVRHKQVDQLIEAFRQVVQVCPNATLEILGDGPERASLQAQAVDLPQVTFYGTVYGAEKVALLHQLDALCLFSNYEPWGMVVNEALAGGTPCIVSACCGCAEVLIQTPQAGLIVPETSLEAQVEAMLKLAQNPATAQQMGLRGATFMQTEWNYHRYARLLDAWANQVAQSLKR